MKTITAGHDRPAFFFLLFFLVFLGAIAHACANPVNQILTIEGQRIEVEVADTEQRRAVGLMYRDTLPDNAGMLFVFEQADRPCFWMKNTFIPLSIAFIKDNAVISSLHTMQPHSTELHCPTEPILYALEMNAGWFEQHGIKAGARVKGLP